MFRITTIFLCMFFIVSVAGRYSAEESVKTARSELLRLDSERHEEERQIKVLRAEIAYLENPERLVKIARATTELRAPAPEQMMSAREFAAVMTGGDLDAVHETAPSVDNNVIENAMAMAQLTDE
ncbi:MAG: hypothetical protein AAGD92_08185 [Pseudomonadota bacterium]